MKENKKKRSASDVVVRTLDLAGKQCGICGKIVHDDNKNDLLFEIYKLDSQINEISNRADIARLFDAEKEMKCLDEIENKLDEIEKSI